MGRTVKTLPWGSAELLAAAAWAAAVMDEELEGPGCCFKGMIDG